MAKLVAIGDSLTQGFQNLAITHVDLSYPAMIARCMGLDVDAFRTPDFRGAGGLPCNLEWLARRVAQRHGAHLGPFTWPAAVFDVVELIDEVEDYWERGRGAKPGRNTLYHNLAVWGFEAGDAYNITAADAYRIATESSKDDWFQPPSEPRMRTAWRVLNPSGSPDRGAFTQIDAARQIKAQEGEIENLIVWLGANNCLRTVVDLDANNETTDEPPGPHKDVTLWRPSAFAREYRRLAENVAEIGAKRVFVATVPHVTIAPIAKGVMKGGGRLPLGRTYFDYYTRFFIDEEDFHPDRDPHITGLEAQKIDDYIDEYNKTIRAEAEARSWVVVDACAIFDQLAVKRNQGRPSYELPDPLSDLDVRYIRVSPTGALNEGGLIGLDGVHPTTCGYAVIAQAFIKAMNQARTADEGRIVEPDYAAIRKHDTLVSSAPACLHDIEGMLELLERRFHFSRWLSTPKMA